MDTTGSVCPWGNDACKDTPVRPDFSALRLRSTTPEPDEDDDESYAPNGCGREEGE